MRSTPAKLRLATWLLVLVACCVLGVRHADDGQWLHSNVFELLPQTEHDALTKRAAATAEREVTRTLTIFVGHEHRDTAMRIADQLAEHLAADELIESATVRIDLPRISRAADFYFPYRQRLLSDEQIAQIFRDDGHTVGLTALAKLYGPLSPGAGSLLTDPFLLFTDSVAAFQPSGAALRLEEGRLWAASDGKHYVLVNAATAAPSPTIDEQQRIVHRVTSAVEAAKEAGAEVIATGFLFFAHAGTQSAKTEISVIGTGSLIGITLLVFVVFGSLRPLGLGLLSIGCGYVLAFAVTLWVFGYAHLTTLVFGSALVGISVDYSLHYVSHALLDGPDWTPDRGLRRVLPGMTMSLATSVVAFLTLALSPFPGFRQLAIFGAVGLIGAYATLLISAPLLKEPIGPPSTLLLRCFGKGHFAAWARVPGEYRRACVALLCALAGISFLVLEFDDDISILQDRPAALIAQQERVTELLGTLPSNAFLLVRGTSAEDVLRNEEKAREKLDALAAGGALSGYRAVSQYVPSLERQERSLAAYETLLAHRLDEHFEQLGVTEDERKASTERLKADRENVLTVDEWLAEPFSAELRMLWLDRGTGESASIVLLEGLRDSTALRESFEHEPAVAVVDKARDLSHLLSMYRVRTSWLLGASLLVVLGLLSLRYGARRAGVLIIPPALGGLIALGVIAALGAPLNLFHLLALALVFGIGIDATLFIAEAGERLDPTAFAITLSALTTILSFGLLSFSTTYAVRSFGLTVLIGIVCAYLLAPLAVRTVRALSEAAG